MVFPATLLQTEIDTLMGYLPAVRDGEVEGVHQARVGTRRLREALPLFGRSFPDDVRRLRRLLKRAGRRLGRVRELDVMETDLIRRAGRMPQAAPTIEAARTELSRQRARSRRRLVKLLDRLRLDRRDQLGLRHRRDWWHPFDQTLATGWPSLLGARLTRRADELIAAIDHAAGLYFPKRIHAVRVATKKLRYTAELAAAGGLRPCVDAVDALKRTQDTLGRLHDAEVLRTSLDRLVKDASIDNRSLTMLQDDLRGEIEERHAKYLPQRAALREATHNCAHAAARLMPRRHPMVRAVALSAAAVDAGLLMLSAREA